MTASDVRGIRDRRDARVCPKDDCNWRQFGEPEAVCPEHGKGVDQPDRPYNAREEVHADH